MVTPLDAARDGIAHRILLANAAFKQVGVLLLLLLLLLLPKSLLSGRRLGGAWWRLRRRLERLPLLPCSNRLV
jgi:hypothetical protein